MLQQMREASRGWIASVLMGLLVISFAIWGIADIFRGGTSTAVAEVGNTEITTQKLTNEIQRRLEGLRQQTGRSFTLADARDMGLDRAALNSLVEQAALSQKLADMGLSISDDQLRHEIQSAPGMQTPGGSFDRQAFQRLLQQQNMSEADFLVFLRTQLLSNQLASMLNAGPSLQSGYIGMLHAFENERRIAEYILIPPERAGDIADPGDQTLQTYVTEHAADFTAPEMRTVSYISVGPSDLMAGIDIQEEHIKAMYEQRKATYVTPEKRVLEQIKFPSKEAAEAAKAKIDGGTPFATIATEAGFKPEDIALGSVDKGDPSMPAPAFELEEGGVSAPLQGPFGWVIVRTVSITPGTEKTYDSVRQELRDALAKQEAAELVRLEANKIEDALGAGMTLEEVATEVKHPLKKVGPIERSGKDATGKAAEGVIADPEFLGAAFDTGQGEDSDLILGADDTYFILRVDGVAASAVKPFADVRADALKAYSAQERKKKLKVIADELAKRGNAGTGLDAIAAEIGQKVQSSGPVQRQTRTAAFSEIVVNELYNARPDGFVAGEAGEGESFVLARLVDITVFKNEKAEEREAFAQEVQTAVVGDLAQQFIAATRADKDVQINEERFRAMQPKEQ